MRPTFRLFANPSASRYLTPGQPTGLTGLLTHPSPRANLVVLYTATLSKLRAFPAHSSYRAATEALTKYRLSIVEAVKPQGWDEWNAHAQSLLKQYPDLFADPERSGRYLRGNIDGKSYVYERLMVVKDEDTEVEWGGEKPIAELEGPRASGERDFSELENPRESDWLEEPEGVRRWVPEPKLDAVQ